MIPKNPEQWKKIDSFLMGFSQKEKILLVHDYDPDGLCSAVIMNKLVERLRGRPATRHVTPPRGIKNTIAPEIVQLVRRNGFDKVIFTDLGVHEDAEAVKKLSRYAELLIIDHHAFFQNITTDRAVLAMPQLLADGIDPSKYCSSKIAYDLANRHSVVEDLDWIAAIGIVADMAGSTWPDFLAGVFEKYRLKPNPANWFNTDFGVISGMFFSAMAMSEKNVNYCFDLLMRANNPKDVLKDKKLVLSRRVFDREINTWVGKSSSLAEKYPAQKLFWFEISPKYHINSPVATILSLKKQFNDWVVLVVERDKDVANVSGRCQSQRVAMNRLMKGATQGLKGAGGGGHVPAAGAKLYWKDLAVFKKRVIDGLTKHLYTNTENLLWMLEKR